MKVLLALILFLAVLASLTLHRLRSVGTAFGVSTDTGIAASGALMPETGFNFTLAPPASADSSILLGEEDEPEAKGTESTRFWGVDALIRLAAKQDPDGSFGSGFEELGGHRLSRTGQTALATLAFMSLGYSHLSKDEYDGFDFGKAVKGGLKWLISTQSEDGVIPSVGDSQLNHILATLALTEAYGMSASQIFKDPAQRAYQAMTRMFSRQSGWGSATRESWAGLAVASTRASELEIDETFTWLNQYFLGDAAISLSRPAATAAWGALQGDGFVDLLWPEAERLLTRGPDLKNLETAYFETLVIMKGRSRPASDGEERFSAWSLAVSQAGHDESLRGVSDSSLVRTSLLLMNKGAMWGR